MKQTYIGAPVLLTASFLLTSIDVKRPTQERKMPKILSEAQVEQYRSQGFVCPVDALSAEEASEFLARMEDLESREPNLRARSKIKPHLLMMWLNDLMRNSNILDAVEDVLGLDIMAWQPVTLIRSHAIRAL
ncbi:hypothetical protein [Bradyrhizobium pachyrhizi]|uniref:hypothetical protein n=1 Tax=Bradyrhizobium pachyrhizi TaxID=280333 RepID=UPI00067AB0AD|nr:hypothetical protein [Bradyrhizobium pachyrhizi]